MHILRTDDLHWCLHRLPFGLLSLLKKEPYLVLAVEPPIH